jgi:hypothetical protein
MRKTYERPTLSRKSVLARIAASTSGKVPPSTP